MAFIINNQYSKKFEWCFLYGMLVSATLANDNRKEFKMDFMERIQFTEQKEANDNQISLMEIAKEIGIARLIAAGLIGCAAFYGFIWTATLLWIGFGGVL